MLAFEVEPFTELHVNLSH